jgi:hypothetical protein
VRQLIARGPLSTSSPGLPPINTLDDWPWNPNLHRLGIRGLQIGIWRTSSSVAAERAFMRALEATFSVVVGTPEHASYDVSRKSSPGEESKLAVPLPSIGRELSELLLPYRATGGKFLFSCAPHRAFDQFFRHSPFSQFLPQPQTSVTPGAGTCHGFHVPFIGQEVFAFQVIEQGGDLPWVPTASQLVRQFGPAVLPPGEEPNGTVAQIHRCLGSACRRHGTQRHLDPKPFAHP